MTFVLTHWQMVTLILTLLGSVFGFGKYLFGRFEKNLFKHFEKLENQFGAQAHEVDALSHRVTRLEEKYRHLPDQKIMVQLTGDMKELRALIKPLSQTVNRMNDYMLRNK